VAEAVIGSGAEDIVVVTGCDRVRIEAALSDLAVRFTHNANWQDGMGSSIATGVAALGADVEGAFIVPGDMPYLTAVLFHRLAAAFAQSRMTSVVFAATAAGEQRNPVLWPRRCFPDLMALAGPKGAKELLRAQESVAVPVEDVSVLEDVDSPADLDGAAPTERGPGH
jgi:molybdenum cofactor cytidylyltransferase